MRRLVQFLGCVVTGAFAEIFQFRNAPEMPPSTLHAYYLFPVYADAVGAKVNEKATVTFTNFEIQGPGIQVSLIPRSGFSSIINSSFCALDWTGQVHFQGNAKNIPVFSPAKEKEVTIPIKATDEYLLTVTNCGKGASASVRKGKVVVKQPHGYLPGNKIWTLYWWGWFTLVNAFLCAVWIIAVFLHSSTLLYIQKVLTGLVVTAWLEGAVQYFLLKDWNNSGSENTVLYSLAMIMYSLKYVLTLRVLMLTSSGSGVIMESVNKSVGIKVDAACFLFFLLQWAWKFMITYKFNYMFKFSFMMLFTAPGTLLWLLLFSWVYRQLHALSATLQDKKLASELVSLFINVRLVLVGAFLLATVVLLLQLADMWLASTPWKLQWLPYDGAPHMVYTLFLLAMMILWWPHKDSWKLGYSEHVELQETEAGGNDHRVEAEQIGANDQKEEEL